MEKERGGGQRDVRGGPLQGQQRGEAAEGVQGDILQLLSLYDQGGHLLLQGENGARHGDGEEVRQEQRLDGVGRDVYRREACVRREGPGRWGFRTVSPRLVGRPCDGRSGGMDRAGRNLVFPLSGRHLPHQRMADHPGLLVPLRLQRAHAHRMAVSGRTLVLSEALYGRPQGGAGRGLELY